MIRYIDKHQENIWFFIYQAGAGGEKFAYELTNASNDFFKHISTANSGNKWVLISSYWSGWFNGGKSDENSYPTTASLFKDYPMDTYPYEIMNNIDREMSNGKKYLSIGHAKLSCMPREWKRSKFFYHIHETRKEKIDTILLNFIKNYSSRLSLNEALSVIETSGWSNREEILHELHDVIVTMCQKFGSISSTIPNAIVFGRNKRILDLVKSKNFEALNSDDVEREFFIEKFEPTLRRISHDPDKETKIKFKEFQNVMFVTPRDMLDVHVLEHKFNCKIENKELFTANMIAWKKKNDLLIVEFCDKFGINIQTYLDLD
jgi:hypothetical protein